MRRRRMEKFALTALSIAVVLPCVALATETPDVGSFPSQTAVPLARLAAAVGGVGLLGWGATIWSRRRIRSTPGEERIEVIARRSLGPRHHVAILDAGGRRLLIGFSGDRITQLADLSEERIFREELAQNISSEEEAPADRVDSIGRFEGLDG